MKTIVTLDKGNQPYGFAQLDANGNLSSSVTASYALTASYAMNGGGGTIDSSSLATTGSNTFVGNQIVSGTLTMPGYNEGNETILAPEGLIFVTPTTQSFFGLPSGLLNLPSSPTSSATALVSSGTGSLAAMAWFSGDFEAPGTNVVELIMGSSSLGGPFLLSGLTIATSRSGSFLGNDYSGSCYWIFNGDDCSFTVADGGIKVPTGSIVLSSGSVEITGSLNISGQSNFNNAVAINDANMNLTNSSSLNLTSGSGIFIDSGSLVITTGSISLNGVTGDLRPYKVYTALLTQNGETSTEPIISGLLTVGTTYTITSGDSADFTNVGAPDNNPGTSFVATGTTPTAFGNGALLIDHGAPVVTVLENTIGNIWFAYDETGQYFIQSNSLFTANKTIVFLGSFSSNGNPVPIGTYVVQTSDSGLSFYTGMNGGNDMLNGYGIEIRVYN